VVNRPGLAGVAELRSHGIDDSILARARARAGRAIWAGGHNNTEYIVSTLASRSTLLNELDFLRTIWPHRVYSVLVWQVAEMGIVDKQSLL